MTVAHKKENTLLINKMLAKFRKPQSQVAALMPISALSLSACGGGGGGGTTPIETSTVINGSVLKGQITNALVRLSPVHSRMKMEISTLRQVMLRLS
jgi:hypothetical protein